MNPREVILSETVLEALPSPVAAALEHYLHGEELTGRRVGELEEALRRRGLGELGWVLVAHVSRLGVGVRA